MQADIRGNYIVLVQHNVSETHVGNQIARRDGAGQLVNPKTVQNNSAQRTGLEVVQQNHGIPTHVCYVRRQRNVRTCGERACTGGINGPLHVQCTFIWTGQRARISSGQAHLPTLGSDVGIDVQKSARPRRQANTGVGHADGVQDVDVVIGLQNHIGRRGVDGGRIDRQVDTEIGKLIYIEERCHTADGHVNEIGIQQQSARFAMGGQSVHTGTESQPVFSGNLHKTTVSTVGAAVCADAAVAARLLVRPYNNFSTVAVVVRISF